MTYSRRLTLQLTPLLDLLLIVMFAQYMEVRLVAARQAEQVAAEQESTNTKNEELQRRVDEWEAERRTADRERQQQTEQVGQMIRELFRIPESVVNKLIQPRSQGEAGISLSEIADLKNRIQQLATARGEQVVDHLLTFNEMRKQFEIWEFYLNDEGELLITAGPDRQQVKSKVMDTPESFIDAVLQVQKRFPPTKNTVLILCRYGDCRLVHRLAMTRGLPAIAERLKSDGQGTTRFEYAVFGYRPQPELER